MRYKLILTDSYGAVVETWNVTVAVHADINDEFNLSKSLARSSFMQELQCAMARNDAQMDGRILA